MTDHLKQLRQALRDQAVPPPRPGARQAAIAAAMTAFDEEFAGAAQGSGHPDRQRGRATSRLLRIFRRRPMTFAQPRLRFALAGGASLAVLAFAAVVSLEQHSQTVVRFEPATSELPEEAQSTLDEISGRSGSSGTGDYRRQVALDRESAAKRELQRPAPAPQELADSTLRATKPPAGAGTALAVAEPLAKRALQAQATSSESRLRSADRPQPGLYRDQGRDRFAEIEANPVKLVREEPVSTFSIDVDTASYSYLRASLNNGVLPQKDAIRVEELINYFSYDYTGPADRAEPFASNVTIMPTPWNDGTKLLHIGIKGYSLEAAERPRANLVFLIDTSGSMNAPDKLPLLINAFKLLLERLDGEDRVAIVTYAGSAGTALEPTLVKDKARILAGLERLTATGSTAGAEGLRQAYLLAGQNLLEDGVNRVILATDGDFNVGITNQEDLESFVERKRESGISLSVLGFGRGNYNDALMQTLAQNGNGNASYIDNLSEARKVLVEQAGATLFTIAKDVKLQIEFNPATVSEYRLIGYETRLLAREDFNNDRIDAGDIGAGHTVTALYEITPVGSTARLVDELRYGQAAGDQTPQTAAAGEYGFLKIRYKLPGGDRSRLITTPITPALEVGEIAAASLDTRFATAVAAFGQVLRGGRYSGDFGYDQVIALAQGARGEDPFGYRAEFLNLVRLARSAAALEPLKR